MTKPSSLAAVASGRTQSTRSLDEHCEWLNRLNFVADSGKPYRISTNERGERYLDRSA